MLDALERAVGAETARQWLNEYREAIASGRLKAQPVLSFDALDALGITGKPGTPGSRR